MTTTSPKPCEKISATDFVESWISFLERLRDSGVSWISKRGAPNLREPLGFMWQQVLNKLIELAGGEEFLHEIDPDRDREMLCRVIDGTNTWSQTGGDDQLAFDAAATTKETVERWLGPQLSSEANDLLKALNQLLCMLHCL